MQKISIQTSIVVKIVEIKVLHNMPSQFRHVLKKQIIELLVTVSRCLFYQLSLALQYISNQTIVQCTQVYTDAHSVFICLSSQEHNSVLPEHKVDTSVCLSSKSRKMTVPLSQMSLPIEKCNVYDTHDCNLVVLVSFLL